MTRESTAPSVLYLHVLAFCAGMSIMAIELCAARLLAPYFGSSTFVWTNVIGVILIALAAGYLLGGRLADRRPRLALLLKLLLAACAYLVALPYAAAPLLGALSVPLARMHSSFGFIFGGSLVALILLFSPPIVVMGMTSPFLIRLLAQRRQVGEAAGSIFAVSTLGSVLGTFLPVLLFIPTLGTGKTIIAFAGGLLLVAALGLRRRAAAVLGLLALAPLLGPAPAMRQLPGQIWAGESAYQTIQVVDRGSFRFLAYDDAAGWQTVANRAGPLTGRYYDYYSLLPRYLDRSARSALVIGLGGGVIANQLRHYYPQISLTGVEIDPLAIDVARRFFALDPATRVVNQDGRIFASLDRGTYDIAVVDAYTRQVYIPFHLATRQFFAQVKNRLAADGLLAMNVSSVRKDSPLVRALCATLRAVFAHAYVMRIPGSYSNVVLASDRALNFAVPAGTLDPQLERLAAVGSAAFREDLAGAPEPPLTDDRAPLELLMDWELLARRAGPG